MKICIVGGGINGLTTSLCLSKLGYDITLFEEDGIMSKTSSSSTKLIHGGLRYLENGKFKLVRESLRSRNYWINYAPDIVKPIKLLLPIYENSKRGMIKIKIGLFFYDLFSNSKIFPKSKWVNAENIIQK